MSSVKIKVMTVVMTEKVNPFNWLNGLSSMSSLKKYIPLCSTNEEVAYNGHISKGKRQISHYIYCCFFSDDIDDKPSNLLFVNDN
jgi:hypothetical protein